MTNPHLRIGIDLGGTKIEMVALASDGEVKLQRRIATPRYDYSATLKALHELVNDAEDRLGGQSFVGVGMPGAISLATGRVKNANSTWLNDRPLNDDLQQLLGRPVRLANDADCFALSEATDGAAQGAESVFGVILGTGVGAGVIFAGRLQQGPNGIRGEWGHNPLPWPERDELPGPPCYCGRHGCLETWLAGPALSRDHHHHSGQSLTAPTIVQAAAAGDRFAQQSLERYAHRLARGLAMVINILDPHVIVLGGGLSQMSYLYRRVPELWSRWVFSDRVDTRLLPPRFGAASGVRGAAWLWPPP